MANAEALLAALHFCAENGIGCFRVNSQILPLKTHPQLGYRMDDLPQGKAIVRCFKDSGAFPDCWLNLDVTVAVEAKAKELAVLKLKAELARRRTPRKPRD